MPGWLLPKPDELEATVQRLSVGGARDGVFLLVVLRARGFPEEGLARLLRLRHAWLERAPALDGLAADARLEFARWLYEQGRIGG